jgi:hypothetical protein
MSRYERATSIVLVCILTGCAPQPATLGPTTSLENAGVADMPLRQERNIAITHRFTLRIPRDAMEAVQRKHLDQCVQLGCTILNTSLDRLSDVRLTGRATVRIRPDAYAAFAALLAMPPARIASQSQSSEDLAAPTLDLDRRLEVKIALRDRLTAMLRDSSVKTAADLITIEKELAQAQSDIEAMTAQREGLRVRTDNVRIEIYYQATAAQVAGVDLAPIQQSISGIGQTMVSSVAWLISFLAAVVPWLPLIALFGWGTRRAVRRWRSRKVQQAT